MANEERLIDANAFMAYIDKQYCTPCKANGQDYHEIRCRACWVDDMSLELDAIPTVDAVEVVRCKDCEHFNKRGYDEDNAHEEDSSLHMGWCTEWRRGTQACCFCSHGERRL